jgi:hypothetical protein
MNEIVKDLLNFSANNTAINDIYNAETGDLLIKGEAPLNVAENVGQVYLVIGSGVIVGDNIELSVTEGMLVRRYQDEGIEYEVIYTPSGGSMYEQLSLSEFNALKDGNSLSIGKSYKVMGAYSHPILGSLDIVCQADSTVSIDGSRCIGFNNSSCPYGANIYTNTAFTYAMVAGGFINLTDAQVILANELSVANQLQSGTRVIIGNLRYATQIRRDSSYTANYQKIQLENVFDLKNQVFGTYNPDDSSFLPNRELYSSIAGIPDETYDITKGYQAYKHVILNSNTGLRYLCTAHATGEAVWTPMQGTVGFGEDAYTPEGSVDGAYIGGISLEFLEYNVVGRYCHITGTIGVSLAGLILNNTIHNVEMTLPFPIATDRTFVGCASVAVCSNSNNAGYVKIVPSTTNLKIQIQGAMGVGFDDDFWIQFSGIYEILYND